jgi:galactokinase
MVMLGILEVKQSFDELFSGKPDFYVRAPGRVNLIGEHTDYNDGFVLPMAIDRSIWIAFRKRLDREILCYSTAYNELLNFSLDHLKKQAYGWGEYLKGVAWILQETGLNLRGWEGVLSGDIPIGAGLGSSAALEIVTLRTFSEVSDFPWEPVQMAKLGQQSEIEWVGLDSGIMDQMISARGQAGYALLLDCRTLEFESIPIPENVAIAVLDTGIRRELVVSEYNRRRSQCKEAAMICRVPSLRDLNFETLEKVKSSMDPTLYKRAYHVMCENDRTLQAAEALRSGNGKRLGELMNASHRSLREDYEVSSEELDALVEIAQEEGALGARMTGAGFGGCVVSLLQQEHAADFTQRVVGKYGKKTGLDAQAYLLKASQGVGVVPG